MGCGASEDTVNGENGSVGSDYNDSEVEWEEG